MKTKGLDEKPSPEKLDELIEKKRLVNSAMKKILDFQSRKKSGEKSG